MSRFLSSLLSVIAYSLPVVALDKPAVVERAATLQRAMADARDQLASHHPVEAAAILEAQLAIAEGNKAYLNLLRDVYTEELKQTGANSPRSALVRERLILLGGTPPAAEVMAVETPKPAPVTPRDFAREAAIAFQQQQWAEASKLFAEAAKTENLTEAEQAAWKFCREKTTDTKEPEATKAPEGVEVSADENMLETESFRIRHGGSRERADALAKTLESKRKDLFARWSGPVTGGWSPKCEIVLHRDGEIYAKATGRPANGAGHATVRFTAGKVAERKLDLRADDVSLADDALPRELTHIILADLFPSEPPPLWAEAGIAVINGATTETDRYHRTLQRCGRAGELFAVGALLELKAYPDANRITAFYCQSVSMVAYLVELRGERNFTIFLRDMKRYGVASALKKTYELDGIAGLEREWRQQALSESRAQAP